ncbi:dolichol-phosphate mannosyltransferase [Pseudobutyrivibrio sp. 49]|uniref:glycosyltransferase family 2 protein n=1 Tax=unclassified Pseudobutyrivibrio TaxID=2638619 RepID=UPI00088F8E92|nr:MULTISPECIES: glycosyltransferase family 2 protein [unclassified Pseudobutyrivibrio]SDH61944.1 dolichol-phosphate mannosyltransferase [Pseudobutyrivibrio sp. 49]SFN78201.1 dolichol-phosphate mannosyltransferase [Pseudobutyrivibrio sp. UC1225]
MLFSAVIPVYGCRAALPELHRRLTETFSAMTTEYEIVLVNDNCPENSWEVIEELCAKDSHVKGIELSRNFGQQNAILAGLNHCTGEWVIVMDCDLQDRPEEIPRLYAKAQEGYDVVFARRADRQDSKIKLFWASRFYKVYNFATDGTYDGALCNFSVVNKKVIKEYCAMPEQYRDYVMYIKWLGFRTTAIDVEHNARFEGESSYTFQKKVNLAIELLTSQSDKMLRLVVGLGFGMTLLSFIAIILIVIQYFIADVDPGWSSIVASNFLIGGLTIMTIGMVGIYVGNIFVQTKDRPKFVIRQILNDDSEER